MESVIRRLTLCLTLVVAACADEKPRAHACVIDASAGQALRALPGEFVDWWLAPNSLRQFTGQVSRADCGGLEGVAAISDQTWLTAELQPDEEAALRRLVLTVDASQLGVREPGVDGHDEARVTVTAGGSSAQVRVRVRVIDLLDVHVGPEPGTCRRPGGLDSCDVVFSVHPDGYLIPDALQTAAAAHAGGGVHFILYDNLGEPVVYDAGVVLGPDTWISAALDVPANRVLLTQYNGSLLRLAGDRVHVERLTLFDRMNIQFAIAAADSHSSLDTASRGHLIENVVVFAYSPQMFGDNQLALPFVIGADTVVRNNYIHGFFGGWTRLDAASGSRIVGNTIVYYGDVYDPWSISGASDLTIANNVVVVLTRPLHHWLEVSGARDLDVRGNAIEGYESATDGAEVGANHLGEVQIESPRVPLFLRDSEQRTGAYPGEGTSMDGRDISGRLGLRPGAFQDPSERASPRHELVRLGLECGGQACDISAAERDALQIAVWSSWPRGTVEVYPGHYGRAIISWGTTVTGMGQHPGETTVDLAREGLRIDRTHPSVHTCLFVAPGVLDPVHVSNLTLLTSEHGIVHSASAERASHDRHVFERLIIFRDYPDTIEPAIVLGHNVSVRDVFIHGPFESCVTMGGRNSMDHYGPLPTTAWLLNVTCWLTGYATEQPGAAFWVGNARDGLFANLIVEAPGIGLFRANIDSSGNVHAPAQFTARAVSYHGITSEMLDITPDPTRYALEDLVVVADGDPFLAADGSLEPGASGIDDGVDPQLEQERLLRYSVELGTAINGVARAGRDVDRGAYEQGN